MKIVVDTDYDITQLFSLISEKIKKTDVLLENFIIISRADVKIKNDIADVIADYIVEKFEQEEAQKYIKPFELLKKDVNSILKCLKEDENLRIKRQNLIKKEILSILSSGHLNVDGVIKFRLLEYKKELFFTLDILIDELTSQKSYDEFISLMKYFADTQPISSDTVFLVENSGKYSLTDDSGKPIKLKFNEEFADEIMPIPLSNEELLISNLMAAMPEKIIFNNVDENKPIINTIKQIFEGRISDGKEI